jgi:pantothenate kinase type III
MYERFTERARKVMVLANQEAKRFNHEYIGTEHLLLGLIRQGSGTALDVIKQLGVDPIRIRFEVEKLVLTGPEEIVQGKVPQTPRAKKVLEYSMEECRSMGSSRLGTEHILLGLLRENECVAFQVLENLGINIGIVRNKLLGIEGPGVEQRQKFGSVETPSFRPKTSQPDFILAPKLLRADASTRALIAVDIGNSAVKFGHFSRSESHERIDAKLPDPVTTLEIPIDNEDGQFDTQLLLPWCEQFITPTTHWTIASVNRAAANYFGAIIASWCKQLELDQQWQARGITFEDVPMPIRVDEPSRVGIDRLLAGLAVNRLRAPDRAAIVIDLGTAITVDLVEADGAFAGGAILPGIGTAAGALADRTDALPHIELRHSSAPPAALGKSTTAAIEAGLYWGAVGSVTELVSQFSASLSRPPDVFITGGAAPLVIDAISAKMRVQFVPHLVLSGIALLDSPADRAHKS